MSRAKLNILSFRHTACFRPLSPTSESRGEQPRISSVRSKRPVRSSAEVPFLQEEIAFIMYFGTWPSAELVRSVKFKHKYVDARSSQLATGRDIDSATKTDTNSLRYSQSGFPAGRCALCINLHSCRRRACN